MLTSNTHTQLIQPGEGECPVPHEPNHILNKIVYKDVVMYTAYMDRILKCIKYPFSFVPVLFRQTNGIKSCLKENEVISHWVGISVLIPSVNIDCEIARKHEDILGVL